MRAFLFGTLVGLLVVVAAAAAILRTVNAPGPGAVAPTPSVTPPPAATTAGPIASETPREPPATPEPSTPPVIATPTPDASGSPTGVAVGQPAPDIDLANLRTGEGDVELEDFRGKPVWVNFTASWCPTCRDELGLMQRMAQELGDELGFLVVDVPSGGETLRPLVEELGLSFPVGLDDDGTTQRAWGAWALPTHYWLDADGIVRGFLYGGGDPERFLEGVRTVLPEATFEP